MDNSKVVRCPLATYLKLSTNEIQNVLSCFSRGSSLYVMVCTRSNISHGVSSVSKFVSNPGNNIKEM
jgi:hypothetical protein